MSEHEPPNRNSQGWSLFGRHGKAHYFRAGETRSLCKRWTGTAPLHEADPIAEHNCKRCQAQREKLLPAPPREISNA